MNSQFPEKIPVFPLSGVIYFPNTNLPLNVFEDRYLSLVNDVIKTNKLMGMVQSIKGKKDVYNVGCLGKISDFRKSDDGRILLNLTGITRFEIKKEIETTKLYREFFVDYKKFTNDIERLLAPKSRPNPKVNAMFFYDYYFFVHFDLKSLL